MTERLDKLYDSIRTFADLAAYADAVYEMISDEADMDKAWQRHAPWRVPAEAEVLRENGNGDITIRLPSGEVARWRNDRRKWEEWEQE